VGANAPVKRSAVNAQVAGAQSTAVTADSSRRETIHIGPQLRHYRKLRGLRLKELADLAGCSESLLSRIENNRLNPSVSMLHRLCKALDTGMSKLMTPTTDRVCTVFQPGTRPVVGRNRLRALDNGEAEIFIPYAEGRLLEGLIETLHPGGHSNGVLSHEGEEAGYVIEGHFELTVNEECYLLGPGATFFFRSDLPHAYRNPGTTTTRVVWINTPPSF
jgi:transcriptional regulator with XRE-family HTH domain